MRITSKILSVILVMCMLLTSVGFAAAYTDVSVDDANYPAVSLLSSLGIIKGYEDGSFGPDKNVTRAEFTVMLIRTLNMSGIGSSDPAGLPFEDVASVDWAVGDIRTAYDLGIINGMSATEFAPNDQVTSEQALKMIVCAMGYEPMAIDIAGGADKVWPTGYTTVAGQLNLTAGVTSAMDAAAKRIEIAKYIYNALEVDLMQSTEFANGAVKTEIKQGVNILNDKLKVLYGTGELRADNESSAEASGTLARAGEVLIYQNDESVSDTFYVNDISTKGLVGRSIKYYYKRNINGEKTLVHLIDATKSSSVLSIDPEAYDGVTGTWATGIEISYWEDDYARNTTKVNVSANPILSINGRVVETSSITPANALAIDSGSIELVDSTNSGNYNKINIVSYQTWVVGSVSTSQKLVMDYYRAGVSKELNEDDVQTTLTMTRASNGSTASLSSLAKFNVLSIKESAGANNKKVIEVVVSNEKVSGTINSIDLGMKELTVNSKTYKLSNYILNYANDKVNMLEINDTCDFYLDKDGNIAAFEKTESTNTTYAYICGAGKDNAGDVASFRIIDSTGAKISINAASRLRIDGESYSDPDDIISRLNTISNNVDGNSANGSQLVKITKNSSGVISSIDTVAPATNESETDLKQYPLTATSFTYKSSNKEFSNGSEKFMIDSSTIIISVPSNRMDYTEYAKRNMSYFKDGRTYSNIEVFDKGDGSTDKAKCIVIYGSGGAENLTADSPILILTSRNSTNNSESEQVYKIGGYLFGEGEANNTTPQVKNTTDTSVMSSDSTGDVFRVAYTNGNEYNSNSAKLLSVYGPMGAAFYQEGIPGSVDDDYITAHGLLLGASEDSFVVAKTNDIDDLINEVTVDTYSFSVDSNTVFAVFDINESENYRLRLSNDNILMSMPSFDSTKQNIVKDDQGVVTSSNGVEASEIFTYVVNDRVVLVYQIIR